MPQTHNTYPAQGRRATGTDWGRPPAAAGATHSELL